ncbi:3'(2'),5'-bisphosphate nucleotidase CysQ [Microvirga pudoricolor]|uniref:3'(2'),5'-bisphosphate nucleotidase CysQ n=1 Tax=Microvirga pudoricolor TaxID=2778729 RepID=UPI00194F4C93|nr:3'(2'),5'-bisphosphate nucleotidase CysQ [Microvirga pudoricolor]MBM6596269.1 3'(2'),5'-bisphosphate nucleotidase CysQ [Microvirga pudoricolor]
MQPEDRPADAIAFKLAEIAVEAGRLLRRMEQAAIDHRVKDDGSPTTEADYAAETLIIARLNAIWPEIPVIAEETANAAEAADTFFLVDPLDGTGDFIRGTGEYSVNIALIRSGRPAAAAVSAPALGKVWAAGEAAYSGALSEGADVPSDWEPVRVRPAPDKDLTALVSRRHGDNATEACLSALSIGTRRAASSALKFCFIADGEADVYVRCGPTMEWDTAAGDHILVRAGGVVIGPGGSPLTYGHEDRGYRNGPFAALGDHALAAKLALPAIAA